MADLVAIDLPAGPPFVDALRRIWDAGDAALPLQQEAPEALRRSTASALGAATIIGASGPEPLPRAREIDDGAALVMTTSGSTGEPKGVVIDHQAIEYSAFAGATALSVDPHTHWLACLPLSHVGGLSVVTRALATGAELTVIERFSSTALDEALLAGATHVSLVPTALGRIDPTPWRRILVGGSGISTPLPPNCTASYGMTETMGGVVYDGIPLNGVEVRIIDTPAGSYDVVGPIEIRTPTLMRGYRPTSDAHGVVTDPPPAPIDGQGWYATGDLGRITAPHQRLEVLGRADDLIITGAEKVWPAPVQQRILEHPAVADVAVYGIPDPEWGELVTAAVVTAPGHPTPSLEEVRQWVAATLPRACAPKAIKAVADLPRTPLGKLRRSALPD